MIRTVNRLCVIVFAAFAAFGSAAQQSIDYTVSAIFNGSSGSFAPYFIGSLNNDRISRRYSSLADIKAAVEPDRTRRFSWGAGLEVMTGYSSPNYYERYYPETQEWGSERNQSAAIWIQQAYAEIKFRSVFLRVGQKDPHSLLLDERLSSGDLTRSSNARGIPGVTVGFIDFVNIPFTNGWVQIEGIIEYAKFTDDRFNREQYNYYNWLLTVNDYYTYKRCYFRSKPSMPFSVTAGMQVGGQFGGSTYNYNRGVLMNSEHRGFRIADIFKMLFPIEGNGDSFYEGNTLGTWDFMARYRFKNGAEIKAAFQGPWEDGSGIGRSNGVDGLWGLYYTTPGRALVNGAAVEWLDFRNQSGPIHWNEDDYPGTTIISHASGGDNYYNNTTYCAYANYGMAIATPFLVAPIYNLNGYPGFLHNRARGLHLAITGCLGKYVNYSLKYSWQQAWGMGRIATPGCLIDNSAMAAVSWDATNIAKGLSVDTSFAFDAGSLRGNNFGFMLTARYSGSFNFKKK